MNRSKGDSLTDEQKGALVKAHLESLAGQIVYDNAGAGAGADDDYDSEAGDGAGGLYYRTKPKKVHCYLNTVFPQLKVALKDLDLLDLSEDPVVVDAMVRYIETGDVDISPENIDGHFEMAFALDIDSVVNCWSMREQAIVCQDSRVLGIVNAHIKSHFDAVTTSKSFLEMPYKKIDKLFQNWDQVAPSENDVRHAFEKWVAHNPANRSHLNFDGLEGIGKEKQNTGASVNVPQMPATASTSSTSTITIGLKKPSESQISDLCEHCGEIVEHESIDSHYKEHVNIWKHQLDTLMLTPRPPVRAPAPVKVEPPKVQMQIQTQPEPEIIDLFDSEEESQPIPLPSAGYRRRVPSGTAAAAGGLLNPFQAYCKICDLIFPRFYEYAVHMQGKAHREALQNQNKDPNYQPKAEGPMKIIDSRLSLPHATLSKVLSRQSLAWKNTAPAPRSRGNRTLSPPRRAHMEMESDRTCTTCKHTYTDQRSLKRHFQTKKHKLAAAALKKSNPIPVPVGPSGSTNTKSDGYDSEGEPDPQPRVIVRCEVCQLELLNSRDLGQHEKSIQHRKNLLQNSIATGAGDPVH